MELGVAAAIGELISALAVVISVLYLAAQVKQGNRQNASEAGFAIVSEMSRLDEIIFTDVGVAKLFVKLKENTDLTEEERIQAEAIADRFINTWYIAENSYINGTMSQSLYNDCADDAKRYMRSYPALRNHCRNVLTNYDFAQDMKIYSAVFDET